MANLPSALWSIQLYSQSCIDQKNVLLGTVTSNEKNLFQTKKS